MKTNENFQLSTFNFQLNKRLAVVILNWNGRALMEEYLPSVVAYTPDEWADVIVADNGSTDDSIEMLKAKFPTVGIIRLDKNYGFAEGYNQALKHIGHEYTVLLNSDVEVTPGWLDAPVAAMDTDKTIAGVQPKIRALRNKEYFEYAGAAGGYMDRYGYPYCRGRVLHVVEKDAGQYDTPADLLWATGACLFVQTAVYKEVGGLDAGFFAHQEEIDMCWRLRSRGYRLVCTPSSVVYHVGGATLNVESPRKTFLNFRNNLFLLYKNLPPREGRRMLLIRRLYDTLAFFVFIAKMDFANARAILRAHNDYRHQKSRYDNVRPQRSIMGDFPCCHRNIILDYNLRRIRHYSDLK